MHTNPRRLTFPAAAARLTFTAVASRVTFEAAARPTATRIGTLRGYPIVWNAVSSDRGGFRVRLLRDSAHFTAHVVGVYNHDMTGGHLVDTATGGLRVGPADDYGVPIEMRLPDTHIARHVLALVRAGKLQAMSFAMCAPVWQRGPGGDLQAVEGISTLSRDAGGPIINASRYDVDEVSIVEQPSFEETSIAEISSTATPPQFASRTRDALRLQKLRFDGLTLSGG
ncbi:MAG TPA: HK97 family phage prohead protease [Tepidisphaeraceae bacterium]